ncbi:hypothetical protein N7478_000458 [Penicillium angulare]|nr:hypothetical protein N7478_000458 [Penicillium angulare]
MSAVQARQDEATAERTGSPVLHTLWSYVLDRSLRWIIWYKSGSQQLPVEGSHSVLPIRY